MAVHPINPYNRHKFPIGRSRHKMRILRFAALLVVISLEFIPPGTAIGEDPELPAIYQLTEFGETEDMEPDQESEMEMAERQAADSARALHSLADSMGMSVDQYLQRLTLSALLSDNSYPALQLLPGDYDSNNLMQKPFHLNFRAW